MSYFPIMFLVLATWVYLARAQAHNSDKMRDADAGAVGAFIGLALLVYIILPALLIILICMCLCRICSRRPQKQTIRIVHPIPSSRV